MAKARKPKAIRPSNHSDTLSIIDSVLTRGHQQVAGAERERQVREARDYQVGVVDRQAEFAALDVAHAADLKAKSDAAKLKSEDEDKAWWETGLEGLSKAAEFAVGASRSAAHELQDAVSQKSSRNFSLNDFWNQTNHPSEHISGMDLIAGSPFGGQDTYDGRFSGEADLVDRAAGFVAELITDPLSYVTAGASGGNAAKSVAKGIDAAAKAEHAAAKAAAVARGLKVEEAIVHGEQAAKAVSAAADASGVMNRAITKGLHGLSDAEKAGTVPYLGGKAIGRGGVRLAGHTIIPEAVTGIVSAPFTAARNSSMKKFVERKPELRKFFMIGRDPTRDAKLAYRYGMLPKGVASVSEAMAFATKAKTAKSLERATVARSVDSLDSIFKGADNTVVKQHLIDVIEGSADPVAIKALKDAGIDTDQVRKWLDHHYYAAGGAKQGIGYQKDYFPHMLTSEAKAILGKKMEGGAFTSQRILTRPGKDVEFLGATINGATVAERRLQANVALKAEADRLMAGNPTLARELQDAAITLFGEDPKEVLLAYARMSAKRKAELSYAERLAEIGIGESGRLLPHVGSGGGVKPTWSGPFLGSRGSAAPRPRMHGPGGPLNGPFGPELGPFGPLPHGPLAPTSGPFGPNGHMDEVQGIADLFQARINEGATAIGGAIDSGSGFAHVLSDLEPATVAAKAASAAKEELAAKIATIDPNLELAEKLAAKRELRRAAREAKWEAGGPLGKLDKRTVASSQNLQQAVIESAVAEARAATDEVAQKMYGVEAMQVEFNNLGHDIALEKGFGYADDVSDPFGLGERVLMDDGSGQAFGTTNSARLGTDYAENGVGVVKDVGSKGESKAIWKDLQKNAIGYRDAQKFIGPHIASLTPSQHQVFEDLISMGMTRTQAMSQVTMTTVQRAEVAARQAAGESVQGAVASVDHAARMADGLSLVEGSEGYNFLRTGLFPGDVKRSHKLFDNETMGKLADIFADLPAESVDEFVQVVEEAVAGGVRFGTVDQTKTTLRVLKTRATALSDRAAAEAEVAAASIVSPETVAHVIQQRSELLADLAESGILPRNVVEGVLSRADTTVPHVTAGAVEFERRLGALGRAADELFPLARAKVMEQAKPAVMRQGLLEHVAASSGVEDVLIANAMHVADSGSQLNLAESLLDMGDMVPSGPLSGADLGISNPDTGAWIATPHGTPGLPSAAPEVAPTGAHWSGGGWVQPYTPAGSTANPAQAAWAQAAQNPATPLNVRLAAAYQNVAQNASAQMGAVGSQVMPLPGGMHANTPLWQLTKQTDRVQFVATYTQGMRDAIGVEVKRGLLTPEAAMKHLRQLEQVEISSTGFWKVYDGVNGYLKRWMLATPGFPQRNLLGGIWNNTLESVGLQDYKTAIHLLKSDVKKLSTSEQAQRRFIEDTIGGSYIGSEFTDLGRNVKPLQKYNPLSSQNRYVSTIGKGNQHVEDILRGAAAAKIMRTRGMDAIDDAVDAVTRLHFNYADLSKGEQYLRRVIPFYTYTSRNLPLQMEMMLRHPQTYSRYFALKRNVEAMSEPDAQTPDWLKAAGIRLPFMADGGHTYATASLPLQDIGNFLDDPTPMGVGKQVASMVTPIIRTPIELKFEEQFFADLPLRDDVLTPVGSSIIQPWLGSALGQLGVAKRQKSGDWVVSEKVKYVMDSVMPQLAQASRVAPGHISREGMSESERHKVKAPDDNQLASVISYFLGLGYRENPREAQERAAAAKRRRKAIDDGKRKKQAKLLDH